VQILAALFIEGIETRQVPGPSTRIDLTGIQFSAPIPSGGFTWAPHLVVLVHCPADHEGFAALEVVFLDESGEEAARSVQPLQIEPGRFKYQLVRAEVPVEAPCTYVARCRIDQGPTLDVPFTHLPALD
jgi:hypothetical protein